MVIASPSLTPAVIGRMTLRNRIIFPAMVTNYCDSNGMVTDRFLKYHLARASGGAALLILESTYFRKDSRNFEHGLSISTDDHIPGLRRLADAIHKTGAKLAVQLCHCGRQTPTELIGEKPLAPSIITYAGKPTRAMTEEDIASVIEDFGLAAARCREAGCDAVEIHGGNGYLLQQFLSRETNKRHDRWGGPLGNRVRFTQEVIRSVRKAVGADYTVILRLGVEETGAPDSLTLHEGIAAATILADEAIDALNITAGTRDCAYWTIPPFGMPPATHIERAAAVRKAIDARIPVIGIGRITSIRMADAIIEKGDADFVVMGRALLADPELITKTIQGQTEDICPCIACNEGCSRRLSTGKDIWCAVNPMVGNESSIQITPAVTPGLVVVVGGGIAGMMAAKTAALRGHKVILFEKSGVLGGRLRSAALPPHKQALKTYLTYLERAVRKSGVSIRLHQDVNVETIEKLKPDHVIVAIGAQPVIPSLSGGEQIPTIQAEDALQSDPSSLAEPIYVIGGGLVGCETAEYLAESGRNVRVFKRSDNPAGDVEPRSRFLLLKRLRELGVDIHVMSVLRRVIGQAVEADIAGERTLLPLPGTLVMATGYTSNHTLFDQLQSKGFHTVEIGDCAGGRRILEAVHQGFLKTLDL